MPDEFVTIRVPKELKKRMKKSNLNWSKELRAAIERKIASADRKNAADDLDSILASVKLGFDSSQAIKETRRFD